MSVEENAGQQNDKSVIASMAHKCTNKWAHVSGKLGLLSVIASSAKA
jgi:hypothetical protein